MAIVTETDLMNRSTCDLLFERDPFLKRLVIEDEIWILCIENVLDDNRFSTRDFQVAKRDFIRRKFFYLFDGNGEVVYYEFLSQDESINSAKYCNQLDKLKDAIVEKNGRTDEIIMII